MSHIFSIVRCSRSLAVAAMLAGASPALEAQEPLTLDEALRLAAERSQELVAQDAAATAAREMAVAAGEPQDLALTFGLDNVPVNGADAWSLTRDSMTMRSIGVVRALTRDEKRTARTARYEREAEAAVAERSFALANLQREAALAWLDRHYAERRHGVLLLQRDEAGLQVEAADLAYRSGRGGQADVFAARASVALIDDGIALAERDIGVARIRLARWIGTAAERPLAAPPALEVGAFNAAELEAGVAHHPMLTLLAWQEQVANAEAAIARANKRPDWSIDLRYSLRGSAYSDMVSINVMRPIQWRQENRQDREVAARLATAQQLRAQREEQTRAHIAEAQTLLEAWQGNHARLERYTTVLIPLAVDRTRAATVAYGAGREPLEGVLDARVAEIETRTAELDLELETARLWAELNYLIPADHAQVQP